MKNTIILITKNSMAKADEYLQHLPGVFRPDQKDAGWDRTRDAGEAKKVITL